MGPLPSLLVGFPGLHQVVADVAASHVLQAVSRCQGDLWRRGAPGTIGTFLPPRAAVTLGCVVGEHRGRERLGRHRLAWVTTGR